jgi:MFS transporter, DHA1 family, tetracycline resistance protein
MNFFKSPKFLIFLIVFVNFLGYGMVFPILPILTEKYGGDPLISGILIAVFSVMQVLSMPIMGRLSDRYGRRPLLIFSLWGTVISFLMMGVTHSIFWLMIARMIDGASGGNISIAQAYMADVTNKKGRVGGMGVIAAGISLGFILGPLWGGFFSQISLGAPFIAAAVITGVSILLTQFFLPESLPKKEFAYEKNHFHFGTVVKNLLGPQILLLNITYLLLFWAQSGTFTTISLFGIDVLHLGVAQTSFIFAFNGVLGALIQGFLINKTVKIVPEKKIFVISAFLSILGFMVMAKGSNVIIYTAGLTLLSVGTSYLAPVVQSLVSEQSSSHEQGGNMGLLQSFGSVGRIFGPIVGGFIYQSVGPFSPAVMGAIIMGIVFIMGINKYGFKRIGVV